VLIAVAFPIADLSTSVGIEGRGPLKRSGGVVDIKGRYLYKFTSCTSGLGLVHFAGRRTVVAPIALVSAAAGAVASGHGSTAMAMTRARRRYRFSEARAHLSTLVDDAEKGVVSVVNRRGSRPVVVVDLVREAELLARAFQFAPEVISTEEGISIWVPELAVGGEGRDLAEAEQATVAVVLDYAAAWCEGLGAAPNHAHRWGWVVRVQLADTPEGIHELLFAEETVLFADESVSPEPNGHQIHTLPAAATAQPNTGQVSWGVEATTRQLITVGAI
jgi:Antitoxin of toxin-antitoxin, RelE / RelB, TA system